MSSQKWTVVDTGKSSPEKNMQIDAELLDQLDSYQNGPILHLYDWETPCASYGHFLDPYKFIDTSAASEMGLTLVKRPTGGGIIFHLTDLAFSILVPATHPGYSINVLDNYVFVNHLIAEAIKKFTNNQVLPVLMPHDPPTKNAICKHFCMAKPTIFDIIFEGKKVGGGAQRRTKHGFLHQGSISLTKPQTNILSKVLLPQQSLLDAMEATTYALIPGEPSKEELDDARNKLKKLIIETVL